MKKEQMKTKTNVEKTKTPKPIFDMTKFVKRMVTSVVAVCFAFTTTICGIGFFYTGGGVALL